MSIDTPAYRQAFIYYLRKGIPLDVSLKAIRQAHPTTYYIWRTSGDNKVRPSHAANNGRIFAWDNPPATGHPGEDFNCRCKAEPYVSKLEPSLIQRFRRYLLDFLTTSSTWKNVEMSLYFFLGNGEAITLESLGHASTIRNYYTQHYLPKFIKQIQDQAATAPIGKFENNFDASYNLSEVLYSYRNAGIEGRFIGEIVRRPNGEKILSGHMSFLFHDQFKDPISIMQTYVTIRNQLPYFEEVREADLAEWFKEAANLWQKPYSIIGKWEMDYSEVIP